MAELGDVASSRAVERRSLFIRSIGLVVFSKEPPPDPEELPGP